MSDLLGLAFLLIAIYYIIKISLNHNQSIIILALFCSFLAGVRISFLPFLIPGIIYLMYIVSKKSKMYFILFFFLGLFSWIIPMILITGYNDFFEIAYNHINGHFFKWGGSVLTNNSPYWFRCIKIFESLWADGLGGWWYHRHWITLVISFGILFFLSKSIYYFKIKKNNGTLIIVLISMAIYFLWIFLFQNIIYKPRHVIPLIPFILMFISFGIAKLNKKLFYVHWIKYLFFIFYIILTMVLVIQHKQPSSLVQLKTFLINYNSEGKVLYSSNLINNFVKQHNGSEKIKFLTNNNFKMIKNYYSLNYSIFSTQKITDDLKMNLINVKSFYHNPYVNRLWPQLKLYEYKKN